MKWNTLKYKLSKFVTSIAHGRTAIQLGMYSSCGWSNLAQHLRLVLTLDFLIFQLLRTCRCWSTKFATAYLINEPVRSNKMSLCVVRSQQMSKSVLDMCNTLFSVLFIICLCVCVCVCVVSTCKIQHVQQHTKEVSCIFYQFMCTQ